MNEYLVRKVDKFNQDNETWFEKDEEHIQYILNQNSEEYELHTIIPLPDGMGTPVYYVIMKIKQPRKYCECE